MAHSLLRRGCNQLEHPRAFVAIVALAALLALPTLGIGFYSDDWMFLAIFERALPLFGSRFDLYHFASGGPGVIREQVRLGMLPWWTDPDIKIHFFRPLSSALLSLDHALFGLHAVGYHVHAVLWFVLLVAVVGLFFRTVLPRSMAALGLLLFAADGTHAEPLAWLADRHMVVAGVLALAPLALYIRHREASRSGLTSSGASRFLLAAGFAVALMAGEAALGAVAYWLSY